VDGREYLDYGMGNAALLLGHAPPDVIEAIRNVLDNGFHFGNDHPMQVEWARLIQSLIPSAEQVRFVNSGSEGTMLALRVARAFTDRTKLLRFEGHFSGWHDGVGKGAMLYYGGCLPNTMSCSSMMKSSQDFVMRQGVTRSMQALCRI